MSKKINEYTLEPSKILVPINENNFLFTFKTETKITVDNILDQIPTLIFAAGDNINQKHYNKTREELLECIDVEACLIELRLCIANREPPSKSVNNKCKLLFPDDLKIITERVKNELIKCYGTEIIK